MDDIKLFVCCHKASPVPAHPLLVPIQVGAALSESAFEGFAHDDEGENISHKNRSYCELTAQYWAWKNCAAEHIGFFHYRRYLYPDLRAGRPYTIKGSPTPALLEELGWGDFAALIREYDLIAPVRENMHVPLREHYAAAPHHRREDLALAEEILRRRHGDMVGAMEGYLSGTEAYFGNIYIMKRALFHEYCAWLFPILEEYDRCADKTGYSAQELRVDGYLAERLFGVWLTHRRAGLRVCELPRVHFIEDDGERRKKQLLCRLLPPGSRLRAAVKKWKERGR